MDRHESTLVAVKPLRLLIIGAGPAGGAAAIFAARAGSEVTLLDRRSDLWFVDVSQPKVGESLPPSVQPILRELGVWPAFAGAEHLPNYGSRSYWGSDAVEHRDYLAHPLGHGWHLDRRRFEQMLLREAQRLGTEIVPAAQLRELTCGNEKWNVSWQTAGETTEPQAFDFVIDASGRNALLARRSGVDRLYEHQQLALVRFLTTPPDFADSAGLVEATAEGWWYTAQLPGQRLSAYFFCRPSRAEKASWTTPVGWRQLVAAAPATSARLAAATGALTPPYFVAADSSILEKPYGRGWLAIGDAALTLDPISSHGITLALVTARDGVAALLRQLSGDATALNAYHQLLSATFYRYAHQRKQLYASENRFSDAGYWRAG